MPFGKFGNKRIFRRTYDTEYQMRRRRQRPLNVVQKRQVKKIISKTAELKFRSNIVSNFNVPQQPSYKLDLMTGIPQGDADQERNGDQIRLLYFDMIAAYYIMPSALPGDIFDNVRLIIFQWKPNNSTAPVIGNILLNGASGGPDFTSQYNEDFKQDYSIIVDRVLNINTSKTLENVVRYKKKRVNCKLVNYQAASSIIMTNAVYVMTLCQTGHLSAFYSFKIYYNDI